jgi:uncharacterized membrane protein
MNVFNLICHRKPERSFFIRDYQFPICSRCTGLYLSLILYFIYTYYFFVDYSPFLLSCGVLLLVPAGYEGITQFLELRVSNNVLKLITGLMGGIGFGIIIKAIKWYIYIKF